ncbi:MurT ligase domain-containing protein [Microcella sp.]|uniref:MurT ligase domain-containing protein n=1 Tax=Microcella sp. TaxID=1913979 RepID=UPI0039196282
MRIRLAVLVGRAVRVVARLRGGGSAIPGNIALRIAPQFLEHALGGLPLGVVFVTGSNGKSTTTNMLVGVLRAHGMRVFTNPSGANLPQGIASALLASVPLDGRVRDDIAVLEVDEAYGVGLADRLAPTDLLLLNLQIDQLNRFHEPDRVYGMLERIREAARRRVIVNASDPNTAELGRDARSDQQVVVFDVAPEALAASPHGVAAAPRPTAAGTSPLPEASVVVLDVQGTTASIAVGGEPASIALPARGLHYAVDAAAALATARSLLGDRFDRGAAEGAFAGLDTVYGRGEILDARGQQIELVMMKNPPSLQLNLDALGRVPQRVMVAVDEGTPDPSWIYDTDLSTLDHVDIVTGTKAWQWATRLAYEGIEVGEVIEEFPAAVDAFLALPAPSDGPKVAVINYELMMELRLRMGYLDLEGGA